MKTPAVIVEDIRRRLTRTWNSELAGISHSWPHEFALGAPTKSDLEGDFSSFQQRALAWQEWADQTHVQLDYAVRRVHSTQQHIPTHVRVDSIDAAAAIVGSDWTARLTRGRTRALELRARFGHLTDEDIASLLRSTDHYSDLDFALLCIAGAWFTGHDTTGLTARQVPIEGFHGKWLNTHRSQVQLLSGRDDLGLKERPAHIDFTYLDPSYLAGGGRHHDSVTVGDHFPLPYPPHIVLICENKDSAMFFPALEGAVTVEGLGFGARHYATQDWIRLAPHLVYWGDIDAHGFEILNNFRAVGINAVSMHMDMSTIHRYGHLGSDTAPDGTPLSAEPRKNLPYLNGHELEAYLAVTDTAAVTMRRLEQERIPLAVALDTLQQLVGMRPVQELR